MKNFILVKFSGWLLLYGLVVSTDLKAQKAFTLNECISYAFEHNPLLQVTVKEISIANIGTQRVKGNYLPSLNFASAFQYYIANRNVIVEGGSVGAPPSLPDGEPLSVKTGYNNAWYPALNINQLIFSPAYRNSYNLALHNQQLQAQQLGSFKIDLISGIYKAFNTCKLFDVQARFLTENIKRLDTLLELTRIKFGEGAGVKIEVNRVEVTGNRMKSELANVKNGYSEALLLLQFQMNYLEKDSMILSSNFAIPQLISQTDTLMPQLLQSTSSVRIENQLLQTQILVADESIKLEKARGGIGVGLDASLGATPGSDDVSKIFQGERWKPYAYVGVNVGVPIFNRLDIKRSVEQKKIQAAQSRDFLDQFEAQFLNETKATYVQVKNALERYRYADANLKLATQNIELLQVAFLNGVADNQDLILGENDLYDNQVRYYNELLQLILYTIEGQRVIGAFNNQAGIQ